MLAVENTVEREDLGEPIIVVSGLPRSGTSMMMKMLESGGLEVFTDNEREADEDNPKGYYEFEKVKNLGKQQDKSWVEGARGKVIKVISSLLKELPQTLSYRVVFMSRDLEEVLISQNKMLERRGQITDPQSDEKMKLLFDNHLKETKLWLEKQAHFEVIYVNYKSVLSDPVGQSARVKAFLGDSMETVLMAAAGPRPLSKPALSRADDLLQRDTTRACQSLISRIGICGNIAV